MAEGLSAFPPGRWLTLGDELSSSNHTPDAWAANFHGTVASQHEEEPRRVAHGRCPLP